MPVEGVDLGNGINSCLVEIEETATYLDPAHGIEGTLDISDGVTISSQTTSDKLCIISLLVP